MSPYSNFINVTAVDHFNVRAGEREINHEFAGEAFTQMPKEVNKTFAQMYGDLQRELDSLFLTQSPFTIRKWLALYGNSEHIEVSSAVQLDAPLKRFYFATSEHGLFGRCGGTVLIDFEYYGMGRNAVLIFDDSAGEAWKMMSETERTAKKLYSRPNAVLRIGQTA